MTNTVDVKIFVVKYANKVQWATPISDEYERVSIALDMKNLTEQDVLEYYSHLTRVAQIRKLADTLEKGMLLDEQEAKDFPSSVGAYSLSVQTKQVEVE